MQMTDSIQVPIIFNFYNMIDCSVHTYRMGDGGIRKKNHFWCSMDNWIDIMFEIHFLLSMAITIEGATSKEKKLLFSFELEHECATRADAVHFFGNNNLYNSVSPPNEAWCRHNKQALYTQFSIFFFIFFALMQCTLLYDRWLWHLAHGFVQ